jgi:hypothetical protein
LERAAARSDIKRSPPEHDPLTPFDPILGDETIKPTKQVLNSISPEAESRGRPAIRCRVIDCPQTGSRARNPKSKSAEPGGGSMWSAEGKGASNTLTRGRATQNQIRICAHDLHSEAWLIEIWSWCGFQPDGDARAQPVRQVPLHSEKVRIVTRSGGERSGPRTVCDQAAKPSRVWTACGKFTCVGKPQGWIDCRFEVTDCAWTCRTRARGVGKVSDIA